MGIIFDVFDFLWGLTHIVISKIKKAYKKHHDKKYGSYKIDK